MDDRHLWAYSLIMDSIPCIFLKVVGSLVTSPSCRIRFSSFLDSTCVVIAWSSRSFRLLKYGSSSSPELSLLPEESLGSCGGFMLFCRLWFRLIPRWRVCSQLLLFSGSRSLGSGMSLAWTSFVANCLCRLSLQVRPNLLRDIQWVLIPSRWIPFIPDESQISSPSENERRSFRGDCVSFLKPPALHWRCVVNESDCRRVDQKKCGFFLVLGAMSIIPREYRDFVDCLAGFATSLGDKDQWSANVM